MWTTCTRGPLQGSRPLAGIGFRFVLESAESITTKLLATERLAAELLAAELLATEWLSSTQALLLLGLLLLLLLEGVEAQCGLH